MQERYTPEQLSEFEQLAREYAHARIFCLPSLQEGFGLAFVEAMAAGLPVVACDASSTPELFGDQGGVLVPPGDDQALSAAVHGIFTLMGFRS